MSVGRGGALLALLLTGACATQLGDVFVLDAGVSCSMVLTPDPLCSVPVDLGVLGNAPTGDVVRTDDGTTIATLPICQTAHRLSLQLYPGHGVFAQGIRAGDYPLAGAELAMDTCGACVRLLADTDAHGTPTRTYMATGGTLHLLAVGAPGGAELVASLENLTLHEVAIDPLTFATTSTGVCVTRITTIDVKAPVIPPR